jgi:oligopeptide/dipeptide ABC transporter ATP-binding protein
MSGCLLQVDGLTVTFTTNDARVTAVDNLSFSVVRGETLVIVGESGSGKSAASLAIMGLVQAPGEVRAREIAFERRAASPIDLSRASESQLREIRGAEIAMIFQEPMTSLNPVYTIGAQIMEALASHERISRQAARSRSLELLVRLGIPDAKRRLNAYPHQLSGGMRQRVMIAMALCCRPSLLIADEPTTALDATIQAQILELIKELQRELAMAVIFITHNLGVAAQIADRIMVMYAGQAVETGSTQAIFAAPRMPYTIGLMRSVPRLGIDHRSGSLRAIRGNVPDPRQTLNGCRFHPRCDFFKPGLCDRQLPELEYCDDQHKVRCLRWREVRL